MVLWHLFRNVIRVYPGLTCCLLAVNASITFDGSHLRSALSTGSHASEIKRWFVTKFGMSYTVI